MEVQFLFGFVNKNPVIYLGHILLSLNDLFIKHTQYPDPKYKRTIYNNKCFRAKKINTKRFYGLYIN